MIKTPDFPQPQWIFLCRGSYIADAFSIWRFFFFAKPFSNLLIQLIENMFIILSYYNFTTPKIINQYNFFLQTSFNLMSMHVCVCVMKTARDLRFAMLLNFLENVCKMGQWINEYMGIWQSILYHFKIQKTKHFLNIFF